MILVKTCAWYIIIITIFGILIGIKNKKATELLGEILLNLPMWYLAYFVIKL
jgi:hypothetical protein